MDVTGDVVILTLDTAVHHAQAVTVGYTPGTAPVKDRWGNEVVAFSGRAVRNDTPEPQLSIEDVTVAENAGTAVFTVTLAAASGAEVTVDYATSDDTALAGSDYTASSGTLTFSPGDTTKTFDVTLLDDSVGEGDETFEVTLSNSTGAGIAVVGAKATINDDEAVPGLTIADATAAEGGALEFTVTLDPVAADDVTVGYVTADGTATADASHVDGADYTAPASNAVLTITAGQSTGTISIPTGDDSVHEGDEEFTVSLRNPSANAVLSTAKTATGTIEDNDTVSNDAALNSLTVVAGGTNVSLTPAFSAGAFEYSGEIANTDATVTVTAGKNQSGATVAIEGDDDTGSANEAVLDMEFGQNEFTVTVTAQDGVTTQEYNVALTRAPPVIKPENDFIFITEASGDVGIRLVLEPALDEAVSGGLRYQRHLAVHNAGRGLHSAQRHTDL